MSVTVKKERFLSHGEEFETKAEADRYDALHTARDEYSDAQRKLQRLLAETQRTADGQVFEFGLFHDYWFIFEWVSFPRLQKVEFFCDNWSVREGEFGVEIKEEKNERWYPITDLYADERNARVALAAVQADGLRRLTKDANELRKGVGLPFLVPPTEEVGATLVQSEAKVP